MSEKPEPFFSPGETVCYKNTSIKAVISHREYYTQADLDRDHRRWPSTWNKPGWKYAIVGHGGLMYPELVFEKKVNLNNGSNG